MSMPSSDISLDRMREMLAEGDHVSASRELWLTLSQDTSRVTRNLWRFVNNVRFNPQCKTARIDFRKSLLEIGPDFLLTKVRDYRDLIFLINHERSHLFFRRVLGWNVINFVPNFRTELNPNDINFLEDTVVNAMTYQLLRCSKTDSLPNRFYSDGEPLMTCLTSQLHPKYDNTSLAEAHRLLYRSPQLQETVSHWLFLLTVEYLDWREQQMELALQKAKSDAEDSGGRVGSGEEDGDGEGGSEQVTSLPKTEEEAPEGESKDEAPAETESVDQAEPEDDEPADDHSGGQSGESEGESDVQTDEGGSIEQDVDPDGSDEFDPEDGVDQEELDPESEDGEQSDADSSGSSSSTSGEGDGQCEGQSGSEGESASSGGGQADNCVESTLNHDVTDLEILQSILQEVYDDLVDHEIISAADDLTSDDLTPVTKAVPDVPNGQIVEPRRFPKWECNEDLKIVLEIDTVMGTSIHYKLRSKMDHQVEQDALREQIVKEFSKELSMHGADRYVDVTQATMPSTLSRRDAFMMGSGYTPSLWRNRYQPEKVVSYDIWCDVSGSMDDYIGMIPIILRNLSDIAGDVWNFSDVNIKVNKLDVDRMFFSTGGTDISGALEQAIKNGNKYVIFISDGDDNWVRDEVIDRARRFFKRFVYVHTPCYKDNYRSSGELTRESDPLAKVANKIIGVAKQ